MRPPKKPQAELLIVTPVWGAYDVTQRCIEAIEKNTDRSFIHVLVNDNYEESFRERGLHPDSNHVYIDVYNDPAGSTHVEQIGKMMDLGLAYGRSFANFKYLVKLETDNICQPHWDTVLINEMERHPDCLAIEAFSVDTEEGQEAKKPEKEATYSKDFIEMNLCLFSPMAMNHPWSFSFVPHSVDILLSRHLKTMSGDMSVYETTKTWVTHYRSSSRKNYDK